MPWARLLGRVGRVLITAGVLTLLFVAYQLWGTGLYEARSQSELRDQLDNATTTSTPAAPTTTSTTTRSGSGSTTTTTTTTTTAVALVDGQAVGTIAIPAIGVDKVVVEGTTVSDLRQGPGHYAGTPLPGQLGNVGIAGHRTTYGAPFGDLDQLETGDEIILTTADGEFRYLVERSFVVRPDQVEVLDPTPTATLTLTTCHPKYSASQRLIVTASLDTSASGDPEPPPATDTSGSPAGPSTLAEADPSLEGESTALLAATFWALVAGLVWMGTWLMTRGIRGWRHWAVYAGALPVFALALVVCFEQLNSFLPTNL